MKMKTKNPPSGLKALLSDMTKGVGNTAPVKDEFLTKEELVDVLPRGKRIRRDHTTDQRWENYFVGIHPPTDKTMSELLGDIFWYDLAEDRVKKWSPTMTPPWSAKLAATMSVPKLASNTRTCSQVGVVVEDEASSARTGDVRAFLGDDDGL